MRNISDKSCIENKNTSFTFHNFFFRKSYRLRDIIEKCGTSSQATYDNKIQRMRISCWIAKATNTHAEYRFIIAFPLQILLQEPTLVLRYTYIACLVI
jgi:hypothetical protein